MRSASRPIASRSPGRGSRLNSRSSSTRRGMYVDVAVERPPGAGSRRDYAAS